MINDEYTGGDIIVRKDKIIVEESVYFDEDPACCPSHKRIRTFTRHGDSYILGPGVVVHK